MKRIITTLMIMLVVFMSGCKNKEINNTDVMKYLEKLESYSLVCDMTMNKNSQTINMEIKVDYLNPDYYKVCFGKDNKQLIIKNDKGVFVITPDLNKQFKFDNSWPNNNTSVYLLKTILNDLKSKEPVITINENDIELECEIVHKTNPIITKLKYICDKEYKPLKVLLLDNSNNEIIVGNFKEFIENPSLSKDIFNEEKYLKQDIVDNETTSFIIEAGYMIEGNSLESSINNDDTTILCYQGSKPYTIIVNKVNVHPEVIVMDEYEEVVIIECGLGFVKENSFRYFDCGYEVTIYSDCLSLEEFENICNNLSFM